ncbi:hypothetical protein [Geobacter sp. AOG2]|uniref:hypothetical protein n=1 Tax=Geobacter sp. AOG2 TaxID=1566347 RepID=UPI001CC46E00|nr:hypothetical protein [Geobacter sp. AOG2]GFE62515.1 hypothetical protein AOG2_31030 [Geobacter sp. AOG2]
MFRSVTYSSSDRYCRYLDISLCHGYCSGVCGGRFGYYLKDSFALEKLPYDLKLSKLIIAGALSPDLFVRLPNSFFKKWTNFPEHRAIWQGNKSKTDEAASKYDIHLNPLGDLSLSNLLHPYDIEPLKSKFVESFKTGIPKGLNVIRMAESRKFLPYEAYFAYWHGYVIVDALIGYLDIDRFLSEKQGLTKIIKRISDVNINWHQRYRSLFNRLSLYRTAMSVIVYQNTKCDLPDKHISKFLLDFSESTEETLETDLEQLLILHDRWQREICGNGRVHLNKAFDLLKQDIYLLFEWLCIATGLGEDYYFKKWSYEYWRTAEWTQLKDIIAYEDFELRKTFLRFMRFYCKEIEVFGYTDSLDITYTNLCEISSFAPWTRSFSEMHKSINNNSIINFKQPRILDYLIIITIRTEIVIRDMYIKSINKEKSPDNLLNNFIGFATVLKNKKYSKVLESLSADWKKTKLNDMPENILAHIDSIEHKKGWTKEMMYFYKQILKFVTSRNYFAHHSYKDEAINTRTGAITADVLKSCIQSLIFLESILRDSFFSLPSKNI